MNNELRLQALYDHWLDLVSKYPNPSQGQKAAITKAWNKFAQVAYSSGEDPHKLSKLWSQP